MTDKTDAAYWDAVWRGRPTPAPLNPRAAGLNGHVPRALHRYFQFALGRIGAVPLQQLLEAGCGGSVFLPYFHSAFGLIPCGIDNSVEGCALSRAIAEKSGIPSEIHLADIFDADADALERRFDIVFSHGLVEHFDPPERALAALRRYLKPGGHMITLIPNLAGVLGHLQRHLNRPVYDVHVVMDRDRLARAHANSGLDVVDARCLMTVNFSILNFSGPGSRVPGNVGLRLASWLSKSVWLLERLGIPEWPNVWTSPLIAVLARSAPLRT